MTEELSKRQADYVAEYRRLRWCAKAADTIKAQAAEIERLKVECQAQYHRGYYDGRAALGETE
jgi:hypothetical protein